MLSLNFILLSSFLLLICYYCNFKYCLWSFDALTLNLFTLFIYYFVNFDKQINRMYRRYIKLKFLNSLGTPRKPIKTYDRNLNDYELIGRRYVDKTKLEKLYDDNMGKIRKSYLDGQITWDQTRASYLINKHSLTVMDHPTIA